MKTRFEQAVDGRRMVKVVFTPQVENPASQYDVQVTFWLRRVETVHLDGEPFGLWGPLSVIRTDTNETVTLSPDEKTAVFEAAVVASAEDAGLAWM